MFNCEKKGQGVKGILKTSTFKALSGWTEKQVKRNVPLKKRFLLPLKLQNTLQLIVVSFTAAIAAGSTPRSSKRSFKLNNPIFYMISLIVCVPKWLSFMQSIIMVPPVLRLTILFSLFILFKDMHLHQFSMQYKQMIN